MIWAEAYKKEAEKSAAERKDRQKETRMWRLGIYSSLILVVVNLVISILKDFVLH